VPSSPTHIAPSVWSGEPEREQLARITPIPGPRIHGTATPARAAADRLEIALVTTGDAATRRDVGEVDGHAEAILPAAVSAVRRQAAGPLRLVL
jgi:hypothetical protein